MGQSMQASTQRTMILAHLFGPFSLFLGIMLPFFICHVINHRLSIMSYLHCHIPYIPIYFNGISYHTLSIISCYITI